MSRDLNEFEQHLLPPGTCTCIHLVPGGDNMLYYKFSVVTFLVFGELEFQQEDYILDNYLFGLFHMKYANKIRGKDKLR